MRKTFIITDTHFNHERLKTMGGGRPDDYEDRIKKSLLRLTADDRLIHLGDVCIGQDAEAHAFFKLLKCQKILIRGNHDHKSYSWYESHGWDMVVEDMSIRYQKKNILLSHAPVGAVENKHIEINIHGHLHGSGERRILHMVEDGHRREDAEKAGYNLAFHFDVAPDLHDYQMMSLDDIMKLMEKRQIEPKEITREEAEEIHKAHMDGPKQQVTIAYGGKWYDIRGMREMQVNKFIEKLIGRKIVEGEKINVEIKL